MILRVVIAAVFCYMATELAPAHTHSKCANLIHACLFAIGIGAAGLAELFEGVVEREVKCPVVTRALLTSDLNSCVGRSTARRTV